MCGVELSSHFLTASSRMIITCPSCSARYPVDASTFAPSGRKVRCAKCGNTWHQAPPSDLGGGEAAASKEATRSETPTAAAAPSVTPAPAGQKPLFNSGASKPKPAVETPPAPAPKAGATVESDSPFGDDDDIMFAPAEGETPTPAAKGGDKETPVRYYDVHGARNETGGALRRYLRDVASMRRGRVVGAIGWVLLICFVASTLYGVVHYRRDIVAFWPSTVRLYEAAGAPINLVGFELSNVSYERQDENGLPVLAISGEVLNVSGETKRVPRLRVGLRDENQQELYHWTFALAESDLEPDTKATFVTRLSSPPPAARDLEVRFVEPEDAPVADEAKDAGTDAAQDDAIVKDDVPATPETTDEASHDDAGAHDAPAEHQP